jgi:pyrimidine-nucleoside phosphorylase
MAIVLKGMTPRETAALTQCMLHSGKTLHFSHQKTKPVDKHSTGGIGDKTSLLINPMIASLGVRIPMIAGRGLGHTGGTIDKLESIAGYSAQLSLTEFQNQVETIGGALIGQTEDICPADKKIYALRDVTGTVESLPLICGSILSKKIAEGIKGLVLDVKCGSGAFMKTLDAARELAQWLVKTGEDNDVKTRAFITNMEEPLGRFIGNGIEVIMAMVPQIFLTLASSVYNWQQKCS